MKLYCLDKKRRKKHCGASTFGAKCVTSVSLCHAFERKSCCGATTFSATIDLRIQRFGLIKKQNNDKKYNTTIRNHGMITMKHETQSPYLKKEDLHSEAQYEAVDRPADFLR